MIKFIEFLGKIYVFVIFVVLEILALNYYASSTSYTKAKLLTASNSVVGGVYERASGVGAYFGLRQNNEMLLREVVELRNRLSSYTDHDTLNNLSVSEELAQYYYSAAHVVNNSITRQENYITINRGLRDDVEANMALMTPDGVIAGYVLACSEKYSICMSVLNTNFRTSGRLKGKDYFGSIYWDGLDHERIMLTEIPKYAEMAVGDTVVTTDYSSIFPPGIMIGTVESFVLENSTYFDVRVKLAAHIGTLKDVILVKCQDAAERSMLEEQYIKP